MSLKNFTFFKILTVCCAFLLCSAGLDAQNRTLTSNPGTTMTVDGTGTGYIDVTNPLTFPQSQFTAGCSVTDVNVTIRWAKTSGTCTAPLTDNSYHSETGFRLVGPNGAIVNLFNPGAYTGTATMSLITQTFDDASGNTPSGATPAGGTYNPVGSLSVFNGISGLGTWTLQGRDTGGGDPLCIDYWQINVVTATDNAPPSASCTSVTKTLNSSGIATITAAEINNNSTDLCGVSSVSVSPSSFNCSNIGVNPVTLTVTDIYGNTSTCGGNVTIQDTQTPTITCPANVNTTTNSGCTATGVALGTPSTGDNCTTTVSNNAPGSYPIGTTTVTWTVIDASSNSATCTQTVTVTDNQDPTISCAGPVSIDTSPGSCSALGAGLTSPSTSDNCGVASVTNDAPTAYPLGTTNVIWTVTDNSGNTATCTQQVLVQDNENPQINCGSAITIFTDPGFCTASSSGLTPPGAVDNCGIAGVVNNAPANLALGNNLIQWTALDNANNSAQCTQTIIVVDNEMPTITCPADKVWDANFNGCSYLGANLGTPTTADNCGVANFSNDGLASYPQGTTVVTWTVTDDSGNTATCTQNVTINGGTTLSGTPTDQTCAATNGSIDLTVTGTAVAPSGNYNWSDGQTVEDPSGLAPGDYTVTVTNTNGCTVSATYTVGDVVDVTPPTITCPADINTSADAPGCTEAASVALGTPVTADDCGVASVTNDAPATFPLGATNVVWTVMDDAGNSASCTQIVTIAGNDTAINLDGSTNETCGLANGTISISITGTAAASYAWSDADINEDRTGLTGGDYTVTVTNTNGCTVSASYTVGVDADLVDPVIVCPADINTSADTPDCTEATGVALGAPSATDDCGTPTVTNDAPASFPVGATNVIWTVTDNAGNSASCTQIVTVTGSDTAISLDGITDETCSTANGAISISITCTAAASYSWSNGEISEDLTGLATGDYTVVVTNTDGCTTSATYTVGDVSVACALLVMPRVFLEGAYAGGEMGDQLRAASLIPTTEPYTADGYAHAGPGGGETTTAPVLAVTGTDAIVDWVIVELRDAATPATVVATRAALVQKDGDVVDVDGVSPVSFAGIVADDYNVAIRHRNHLGAMSMNAIALSATAVSVDFTSAALVTFGTDARKDLAGVMCLHAGNVGGDGSIRATGPAFINDASQILSRLGTYTNVVSATYENQDINMDGNIRATGPAFINDSSKLLGFLGTYTNSRTEQLP